MSTDEAAQFYLNEVCQTNAALHLVGTAADAVPFYLSDATDAASKWRTAIRHEIDTFSSKDIKWPDSVSQNISEVLDANYSGLTLANTLSQAKTQAEFSAAITSWAAGNHGAAVPAQKVRVKLGLSSDIVESCKGK